MQVHILYGRGPHLHRCGFTSCTVEGRIFIGTGSHLVRWRAASSIVRVRMVNRTRSPGKPKGYERVFYELHFVEADREDRHTVCYTLSKD